MEEFYQVLALVSLVVYWLVAVVVTLRIVLKRRPFGVSLAWLSVIYIIPVVGIGAYLLFGETNVGKKRTLRAKAMYEDYRQRYSELAFNHRLSVPHMRKHARPIHSLCLNLTGIPSITGSDSRLLTNNDEIFDAILADIGRAKHTVFMEFYIWHGSGRTNQVSDALIAAVARGVSVRLLLDGVGSRRFLSSHKAYHLKTAGVQVVEAMSPSPLWMFIRRLDLRQHRKIIAIDDCIGYTGSMNMADNRYFNTGAGVGEWIDVMVRVTGPSVSALATILAWDWEVETGERVLSAMPKMEITKGQPHYHDALQVIPSGPGLPDNVIQQVLLLSIYHAKHSITLCSPYFVPSEHLLEALKIAARQGIIVRLIVPDKNDSMMVEWASRSFFSELMTAGVEIYRFTSGLLHTKSVLIDYDHCLIGSVNLDMRSLKLNGEITIASDDIKLCEQLAAVNEEYLLRCNRLKLEHWQERPLSAKLVEQFYYMFAPLL